MLEAADPAPVKIFAGVILTREPDVDQELRRVLQARWGELDAAFGPLPFELTDYYEAEMGTGLQRLFLAFEPLQLPDSITELKIAANQVEAAFLKPDGHRTVNVDVGYIDFHKVVLASTKPGPAKIYLRQGIWADMTLRYTHGQFEPFPWTFPDFADGRYDTFFAHIRTLYKTALRQDARTVR
jgi:hypothetical protein